MKPKKKIEIPELISAYEFARRKRIYFTQVYRMIADGRIEVTRLGNNRMYLNWHEYKHLDFPRSTQTANF